jgi:hypothetical protein
MTIGMLSWGAENTLKQTLESYYYYSLGKDEEKLIYLQEANSYQVALVRSFGWHPIESPFNTGIAMGYNRLVQAASEPFFLFLENDWKLIDYPEPHISHGRGFLRSDDADIVRYRHRKNPGNPLWTRQFQGREYDKPTHLLDAIHWEPYPEKFPEIKRREIRFQRVLPMNLFDDRPPVENLYYNWYFTSSKYANWTNNPHMARTSFLREEILPRFGRRDGEVDIQSWWEKQQFIVAQSDGLFTHDRID